MSVVVRHNVPGQAASGLAVLVGFAALAAVPVAASAQSLFDQLFGSSNSNPRSPAISRPPLPGIGGQPLRLSPAPHPFFTREAPEPEERSSRGDRHTGNLRTLCVRTCDGFYFPINNRSSRGTLHDDAELCHARCGSSEARLFYHSSGEDMNEAVDLAGRSYKSMPNAFLYRKKLIDGCACKPMPWSQSELDRHRQYAIAEGRVPASPASPMGSAAVPASSVTVLAGVYDKPMVAAPAPARPTAALPEHDSGDDRVAAQPEPRQQPGFETEARVGDVTAPLTRTTSAATEAPRETSAEKPAREKATATKSDGNPRATSRRPRAQGTPAVQPSATPAQKRRATTVASSAWGGGSRMLWPGDSGR